MKHIILVVLAISLGGCYAGYGPEPLPYVEPSPYFVSPYIGGYDHHRYEHEGYRDHAHFEHHETRAFHGGHRSQMP
jgi:hypothetical protein